jgi:hypothetical protein
MSTLLQYPTTEQLSSYRHSRIIHALTVEVNFLDNGVSEETARRIQEQERRIADLRERLTGPEVHTERLTPKK